MSNFNFTFDPGTTVQQMAGFELAGRIWASYLTDNITINIHAGVSSSLPSGVIGGALPGMRASESYTDFSTKLQADQKSSDDKTAVKNLNNDFWFGVGSMTLLPTSVGVNSKANTLNLTTANAKALGVSVPNAAGLDGYILFSNLSGTGVSWNYDYTRSSTMSSNSLDFLSTAIHEIGHILGFVSGVDTPGWLDASNILTNLTGIVNNLLVRGQNANPLDFFRYSFDSGAKHNASRDVIIGNSSALYDKYFSIDGGKKSIAQFSSGADKSLQGDGYQASHWKSGTSSIMAPTLRTGQRSEIGNVDLQAFDVIGWDLASTGIGTQIDLSALLAQSEQSLADRIGQTSAWLNANAATAAEQLSQDRSADISAMVKNSQMYNWGSDDDPDPFWQRIGTLFSTWGAFETLDEMEIIAPLVDFPQMNLAALAPSVDTPGDSGFSSCLGGNLTLKGISRHVEKGHGSEWKNVGDRLVISIPLAAAVQSPTAKIIGSSVTHTDISLRSVQLETNSKTGFIALWDTKKLDAQIATKGEIKYTLDWGSDDDPDWPGW